MKYLHIPYTDAVVVVTCNPISKWKGPPKYKPKYTPEEAVQHVRDLYRESLKKYRYKSCFLLLLLYLLSGVVEMPFQQNTYLSRFLGPYHSLNEIIRSLSSL